MPPRVKLPAELAEYIVNAGGDENLSEGWMGAYKHALNRGNVHKGCVLYADAHHGDFAPGGMYAPKAGDTEDEDPAE